MNTHSIKKNSESDMVERISRNDMFIEIAKIISRRSICTRKKVGAVLVNNNRIIATGYNGTLPNVDNEYALDSDGKSRTVHAEANIISFCAKEGVSTKGCTIYVTLSPCEKCAEIMVQAGISRVLYLEEYRDVTGVEVLKSQDIICRQIIK